MNYINVTSENSNNDLDVSKKALTRAGNSDWSIPQTIAEWPYFQSSSIAIDPNNNWHIVYDDVSINGCVM